MTTSHLFSAKIATLLNINPRLQWLLIHQRSVLDQNTLWADARAGQYARLVDGLISPLARGGRMLQAVCFQFEKEHHLIVVHREICLAMILPDSGELLDDIASSALAVLEQCDDVIRRSAGLEPVLSSVANEPVVALAKVTAVQTIVTKPQFAKVQELQSAPEQELGHEPDKEADPEPAWNAFRTHLLEVIGKILSRPQAERLLAIELKALGIAGVPVASEFERIGRDVVAHVPHRSKQVALLAEVLHFLKL